jgi:hypothetical protein
MPRKRSVREDAEASPPRQLRKRLRKAEDQLADAVLKRDRAQARVEALNIIADEIRAQLSEADKSADLEAGAAAPVAEQKPPAARKRAAGRSDKAAGSTAAASSTADKPVTAKKKPATAKKPVTATKEPVTAKKPPAE